MRLVIVGGSDAGTEAALRARRTDPSLEITLLVADEFLNYSICDLPFYLSGEVEDWHALAHRDARQIAAQGIEVLPEYRAETVGTSPLFRHAFRVKRCLVPADGFYEWQRLPDGRRQPHYITTADGQPLAFAGLWSAWSERTSEGPALLTCAILTTTPNATMATIHDRMPVILSPEAWGLWLGRESDPSELHGLLRPYSGDLLLYPVAPLVNSIRHQGPALIEPLLPG